jgi:hypothetical protein
MYICIYIYVYIHTCIYLCIIYNSDVNDDFKLKVSHKNINVFTYM